MRRAAAACCCCCLLLAHLGAVRGSPKWVEHFEGRVPVARPPPSQHAHMARWLVHKSDWGTVATQSSGGDGFPYGNAVAISDGPPERATGRIFFYLTAFDQTAIDLEANPKASLNLCEAQMPDECSPLDPEDPRCAKVTLTGEIRKVPDSDVAVAEDLMFKRHPQMRSWHAHKFTFYEMHIAAVRLLDYYGGYEDITPQEYADANIYLEEMKSDPCVRFPHRWYCIHDRLDEKKKRLEEMIGKPDAERLIREAYGMEVQAAALVLREYREKDKEA